MPIDLDTPVLGELGRVLDAVRDWQIDGSPFQLHPGDIGWFLRFGGAATAAALRTWTRAGRILAVGLLDGADLLRLAIEPDAQHDAELARHLAADAADPGRGVLPGGRVNVEAPAGATIQDLLAAEGWTTDAPRVPLRCDLSEPVPDPGIRVEPVTEETVGARVEVQRSAFEHSTFTAERWHEMVSDPAFADARDLTAFDSAGAAVAAVTVWSAGPGKPGLIEPMGVHRDHRGHGYGRAICFAAAGALRELGACTATVNTSSANLAAVATYQSAGYEPLAEVRDRVRGA
jgi:ribosomal protein S18 acetylase RimI-like enzyme